MMTVLVSKITKTQMLRMLTRAGATPGEARRYTDGCRRIGAKPAPWNAKSKPGFIGQYVWLYRRVDAELALDRFRADREAKRERIRARG